ncbi:MAG TPA: hypothetical protein P5279_12900 [Anaerohalosphaeraceae bacterium]|jgi:hypothetical protein|nr:hypothetical protein [Anaerohalosphaeraceae bacterium]HRT51388.1 hypothetical protein [Anaerohalosphaeraceae bacterium]HRT87297.1 hypothetical protein [Anaerohalosphaeraceae bacterium]
MSPMKMTFSAVVCLAAAASAAPLGRDATHLQYVVINRMPEGRWNQARPETIAPDGLEEIKQAIAAPDDGSIRLGVSFVFSYFKTDETAVVTSVKRFLAAAQETRTPVLVKLDGENWWQGRPDLWNWWDPNTPGYDPANCANVEWTGWGPEHAVKIAWRNWGRQIRVAPPPNLMSPSYRNACREKMKLLVPIILHWYQNLPPSDRHLFIGLNVGWESSIGVNAWHYPDGNRLLDRPPDEDPQTGLDLADVTARGQAQLGYAALTTAGIRTNGTITEEDLCEVVRRHLEDLSCTAARLGIERRHIFTHGAGWHDGELLYDAAVNEYASPGWSFYRHADDPAADRGDRRALAACTATDWAAAEWCLMRPHECQPWYEAMKRTLADVRCRFLCIYNWESIRNSQQVLQAIRLLLRESAD